MHSIFSIRMEFVDSLWSDVRRGPLLSQGSHHTRGKHQFLSFPDPSSSQGDEESIATISPASKKLPVNGKNKLFLLFLF